jgi:hypothetical protein
VNIAFTSSRRLRQTEQRLGWSGPTGFGGWAPRWATSGGRGPARALRAWFARPSNGHEAVSETLQIRVLDQRFERGCDICIARRLTAGQSTKASRRRSLATPAPPEADDRSQDQAIAPSCPRRLGWPGSQAPAARSRVLAALAHGQRDVMGCVSRLSPRFRPTGSPRPRWRAAFPGW